MPTQTSQVTISDETAVPSGDEIYDSLMVDIEPDLLTSNIPRLDAKYAGETAEQKAARMARYEAAYKAYDEAFAKWLSKLKELVAASRRQALKAAEEKDRTDEQVTLDKLMQSFAA